MPYTISDMTQADLTQDRAQTKRTITLFDNSISMTKFYLINILGTLTYAFIEALTVSLIEVILFYKCVL